MKKRISALLCVSIGISILCPWPYTPESSAAVAGGPAGAVIANSHIDDGDIAELPTPEGADGTSPSEAPALPGATTGESATVSAIGTAGASSERIPVFPFGDALMRGKLSQTEAYFEISKGVRVLPGSYLHLELSFSPAVNEEWSTLTVFLDDLPITSMTMKQIAEQEGKIQIPLSEQYLNTANPFHKLTFATDLQTLSYACIDPDNEAFWSVISRNSAMELYLEKAYTEADLSYYPSPFFERGSTDPLRAFFVVPDKAATAELSAVARLAQYFSSQSGAVSLRFPVYYESEVENNNEQLAEMNAIWVGDAKQWSGIALRVLASLPAPDDTVPESYGFIGMSRHARSPGTYDLVISGDVNGVEVASEVLSNENLYGQLQGNRHRLPPKLPAAAQDTTAAENRNPSPELFSDTRTITFQQMNYGDIAVERVREGSARINFTVPSDMDINEDALLRLRFRHSSAINMAGSIATVSLNNLPVGSTRLARDTANGGVAEIFLSHLNMNTQRVQSIDIAFQFLTSNQDQNEEECGYALIGNWAVVQKESSISYQTKRRQEHTLDALPYPFIENNEWNPTTVVLPSNASSIELSETMTLVGSIGESTASITGSQQNLAFVYGSSPHLQEQLADRHIIYVGTAGSYPAAIDLPGSEWQEVDQSVVQLTASARTLFQALLQYEAIVLIDMSPVNNDRTMLSVIGNHRSALEAVGKTIVTPEQFGKWSGPFVLIDAEAIVYNFPVVAQPFVDEVKDLFANSLPLPEMIFFAVLAVILVLLIIILWKVRKRRRTDDEY